jgi:hypothetical protein
MAEISYVNARKARENPASEFSRPQDIVDNRGLTRGQKIQALKRWLFDVERRLASDGEGMAQPDASTADVALLEEIKAAQEQLAGEPLGPA